MFLVYFIDDLWVKSVKSAGNGPISRDRKFVTGPKEHFDEFDFYDNSLHINTINEPVAECTDNVQNFFLMVGRW